MEYRAATRLRQPEKSIEAGCSSSIAPPVPAEQSQQIISALTQAGETETERFWDAKEEMDREAKILRQCLDGHSRSRMWLYMANMLKAGMLEPHDMAQFSDELQMVLKRFQE